MEELASAEARLAGVMLRIQVTQDGLNFSSNGMPQPAVFMKRKKPIHVAKTPARLMQRKLIADEKIEQARRDSEEAAEGWRQTRLAAIRGGKALSPTRAETDSDSDIESIVTSPAASPSRSPARAAFYTPQKQLVLPPISGAFTSPRQRQGTITDSPQRQPKPEPARIGRTLKGLLSGYSPGISQNCASELSHQRLAMRNPRKLEPLDLHVSEKADSPVRKDFISERAPPEEAIEAVAASSCNEKQEIAKLLMAPFVETSGVDTLHHGMAVNRSSGQSLQIATKLFHNAIQPLRDDTMMTASRVAVPAQSVHASVTQGHESREKALFDPGVKPLAPVASPMMESARTLLIGALGAREAATAQPKPSVADID